MQALRLIKHRHAEIAAPLKMALCLAMKSCGPLSASTGHCDTATGLEVDCDCSIDIALIRSARPPA
jgi:hypothetical protein